MKLSGQKQLNFGDKSVYFYNVDKEEELFKMNFKGLDMFFASLDLLGSKGIGNAMVLIDGYNDVTTELYEIPQVRKFVKELFKRYPHVLNYINFDLEGHTYLLASLLDVETAYKGEKLTFRQHEKKYGYGTPMPRFNMKLFVKNHQFAEIVSSMFAHGNIIGATKKADKQVYKLMNIFGIKNKRA